MKARQNRSAALCACLLAAALARPPAAVAEAEKPAAAFGDSRAGLSFGAWTAGEVRADGPLAAHLTLRHVGAVGVDLPRREEAFGWFLLVYDRQRAYISEKFFLPKTTDWPAALKAASLRTAEPLDLSALGVYPYADYRKVVEAYLDGTEDQLPRPDKKLGEVLAPGKAVGRFMLVLPRDNEEPMILRSGKLELDIAPPKWANLTEAQRKELVVDLLARFDRDAWSAREAHGVALEIGKPILPTLAREAANYARPDHARMWMTTALADIADPAAAAALVKLAASPSEGVRLVVAYHGPKQRSDALDKTILARAGKEDARYISLALVGFLVFRGEAPPELLKLSLDSEDPRARATAVRALSQQAGDENVRSLTRLLKDPHQRVRAAAARVLGAMGAKALGTRLPAVLGGMVGALDLEGEQARQRLCMALGELTGEQRPYDPAAPAEARARVLAEWKAWWKQRAGR